MSARLGRIVMLVDNGVIGDSRVQKQAQSAAAAGWEVLLLGRRVKSSKQTAWKIGDADVLLVALQPGLSRRRLEWRRAPLRSPLAYSTTGHANYRRQVNRGRKAELRYEIARAKVSRGWPRVLTPWRQATLLARKVQWQWIDLRARKTERLKHVRESSTGRVDRFWAEFHRRRGDWRRLEPAIMKWEIDFGPQIDAYEPDIIHANDFRMLSVAARAKARAKVRGRAVSVVWDAHEYLPGIKPWDSHPRWRPANILLEREFASHADAVVTVTEPIADLLQTDHHLARRPTVVANAPIIDAPADPDQPDLRTSLGLADDAPLLVYAGALAPQRGADTVVDALPHLPGVHAALVIGGVNDHARTLRRRAESLGVSDRLHTHPYVAPDQITRFLATATIGLIPVHHWPNHELSIATKYYEYSHARLPIVTSDVKALAEAVRTTGQGEVFIAEDVADFVRAVQAILADPQRYRDVYDDADLMATWTWTHHAERLMSVYDSVDPRRKRS